MTFGSLFSGIGGFDLGFERAGLSCAWQCEIDRAASSILARHWPDTTRYTDVSTLIRPPFVHVLCGGFPCQDLSVAGLRAGLAGARSGLWHEFDRIAGEIAPFVIVIENVPGLLSSNRGEDFAIILRGLEELGYFVAWRILDSRWFGVAQRRRRVFIVGSLVPGLAAQILFEPESLRGDFAPRREAGQNVTGTLDARTCGGGGFGTDFNLTGGLQVASCLTSGSENGGRAHGARSGSAKEQNLIAVDYTNGLLGEVCGTLEAGQDKGNRGHGVLAFGGNNTSGPLNVATACNAHGGSCGRLDFESETFIAHTLRSEGFDASPRDETDSTLIVADCLTANWHQSNGAKAGNQVGIINPVINRRGVRRLMPHECEALQGFPRDFTRWTDTGKEQKDGPRYKQLGNAVTVSVSEWVGRRIKLFLQLPNPD